MTVRFISSGAQWRTLLFSGVGFAGSYIDGTIDIDGDFRAFLLLAPKIEQEFTKGNTGGVNWLNSIRNYWHEWTTAGKTIAQARRNALSHYNRGTEMFRQYLDPSMTYTCAYWKEGVKTLEEAQHAKNEHTLKKLLLKPGMTMVDIGGGWCPLLMMAAEEYGVEGTNVSPTPDQNAATQKEIERRGLSEKVHIQEADYREAKGVFDRYVSLGVYEHAGRDQLEQWIAAMAANTKEGGIGMLHFIGTIRGGLDKTGIFIRKYIFPGGYLPGLAETLELMAKYGLEILDIENLRRHYYYTLAAWADNFDKNWDTIHALDSKKYDERFRRTWRVYLHGCANEFIMDVSPIQNETGLFQILWSKERTTEYPMTREFLYKEQKS